MAAHIPATLTGIMVVAFVGVTLIAQTARKGFQQARVMGTVGTVTLNATIPHPTSNGVMFKGERSRLFCMASYAHFLNSDNSLLGSLARVNVMAIAANHATFRKGMVEVEAEFVNFALVTLTAQSRFIGLQ